MGAGALTSSNSNSSKALSKSKENAENDVAETVYFVDFDYFIAAGAIPRLVIELKFIINKVQHDIYI